MALKATVRHAGDIAIVDLAGRLMLGESALRDTSKGLIAQGGKMILVNLKDVTAIDSSGLGQMISCYASVSNAGGVIKMLNAQSRVHDLLTVTKLYSVFESFDNEAKALMSFATPAASA